MNHRLRIISLSLILVCGLLQTGCPLFRDLDAVLLQRVDPGDEDMAMLPDDMGPMEDGGMGEPDMAPMACELAVPWRGERICDPVPQIPLCKIGDRELADARCLLSAEDSDNNGVADTYAPFCLSQGFVGNVERGQDCQYRSTDPETGCKVGLFCLPRSPEKHPFDEPGKRCEKVCEMGSDRGCSAGQYCSQGPVGATYTMRGLGFCVDTCDPTQDTCPTGQVCSVDPYFPNRSCAPRFRCRREAGSATLALGDACVHDISETGCPVGAICYPTNKNPDALQAICVRPCRGDSDCELGDGTTGTCNGGAGLWNLKFCEY